ncbi:uncharacterized protein LOC111921147 [Lactuca sativa]|uniref:uncharacterized protein LOC111921147 n=1 Tax=Lactuca sativa TaxID=4236 RepID=UPI000CD9F0B3|nr:uncharacterized protein LOC111921147 [Lactuca sativa]
MKPHTVTKDQIKLRAFPFSVQDAAKEWLYDLPSGSITRWNELAKLLLEKYFPEAKVWNLHREILGIKQGKREALHTYWERFKKLLVRCPQHDISDYQLYQCFCEGLIPMERRLINASSGGSLSDMTPTKIRALIEKLANESKHSTTKEEWYPDHPRGVKEISNAHLESQILELTKDVLLLTKEKGIEPMVKPCGVYCKTGHPTDMCPLLQEANESVQDMGGFQQRPFDQHRNNQAWGGPQNNNFQPRPQQNFQQRNQYQSPPGFQEPFQQNQHQSNFQQPPVQPQHVFRRHS